MNIFIGRGGSGKTEAILRNIAAKAEKNEGKQLILVPELYSHTYERRLAEATNNKGGRTAEVISFTRLTGRVFAEMGGLADKSLTEAGRLLTITEAARRVDAGLKLYHGLYQKPAILNEFLELFDECKTCCVKPEHTFDVAVKLKETSPALAEKMIDLSQVYTSYEKLCNESLPDPRDMLTRMAELLPSCKLLDGVELFIDAFQSFTPQEMQIIEIFVRRKMKITIALTFDEKDKSIFVSSAHTLKLLKRMAERNGQKAEILDFGDCKIPKPHDLDLLEKQALLPIGEPEQSDGQSVKHYYAANPFAECEYAMAFIRKTMQTKNAKWRDFAIVSRDGGSYEAALRMAAARYDVPIFYSNKTDLLARPPLALLTIALKVITNGFKTEDVIACLKTGLCNLSPDEIDILENYALCWRIKGNMWTKPFTYHPDGYGQSLDDEANEKLQNIENIRKAMIKPFGSLENALKNAKNTTEHIQALYDFLVMMQTPERMTERAEFYENNGDLQLADEYRQLWEIIIKAMEEMVWICGESETDSQRFSELFSLVLGQYDVSSIPVSLDRVTCGAIDRVCGAKRYPYLIVLGVNDGVLPSAPKTGGVLSDHERMLLECEELNLSASATERMLMEQEIMYRFLSCATKQILLCCHTMGSDGKETRPSYLLGAIENKLINLPIEQGENALENARLCAKRPAFELGCSALSGLDTPAALIAYNYFKDDISKIKKANSRKIASIDTINALYGEVPSLTASRVDLFNTCRFAFFMRHGLKAKPRKKAEFAAPQTGTFIHYVLENTLNEITKQFGSAKNIKDQDTDKIKQIMQDCIENYIKEYLGGSLEKQTARFRYLFKRLVKTMEQILQNVLDELKVSDFMPIDYELKFGFNGDLPEIKCSDDENAITLSGTADRVDGYIKNGKLNIRVMDYKSGTKSFSLNDIWNGLNLQMILYLYAIQQNGLEHYKNKLNQNIDEINPAAVLYIPTKEQLLDLDQNQPDEVIKTLREKALKRSGLVCDDVSILDAMENGIEDKSKFLPVKFKTPKPTKKNPEPTPELTVTSAIASLEKFGKLARFAQDKLLEMAKEMKTGDIPAAPCKQGQSVRCDYCEYKSACKFDETLGDYIRALDNIKDDEFWDKIGGDE